MTVELKPIQFTDRLRRYVMLANYLDSVSTYGNLKEVLLKYQMQAQDNITKDIQPFFDPNISTELMSKTLEKLREKAEKDYKQEIEDYMPMIFNQTLVTACTILDTFLYDCLEKITSFKPKILKFLGKDKSITVDDFIELGDYDSLFSRLQSKVLNDFDYGSIDAKLTILEKLGVDVENAVLLKAHNDDVQKAYPTGKEYLISIYDERISIVHKDSKPIRTIGELAQRTTYINHFILDLAGQIGKHFNIPTDFENFFKRTPPAFQATKKDLGMKEE